MTGIHYRRRLRSRIFVSFVLFGFALTALFAISSVYLRGYLEDKLIGEVLQQNLADYAKKFYVDPNDISPTPLKTVVGWTYSAQKFANVPLAWQSLTNGTYDLSEPDGKGGKTIYKLAVRKDPNYWFFLKYDTTQDRQGQRLLEGALVLSVFGFVLLSLVIA